MTEARIIDGKKIAEKLRQLIKEKGQWLQEKHGLQAGLAVVLVGDDSASHVYVKNKHKFALEADFKSFQYILPEKTSEAELLLLIEQLNNDPKINGILVQLPLPFHIKTDRIIEAINPLKDVDGFHPYNVGRHTIGNATIVPCTAMGCLLLIKEVIGDDLNGKKALVIGRSNIVGKPTARLLLNESCTVTMAHSKTTNLADECRNADILVSAIGIPEMIGGDWIKEGAVVIDVGINRVEIDGKIKLIGDVKFDEVLKRAAAITPVPGGVGPMTIALLLQNTLKACFLQNSIKVDF